MQFKSNKLYCVVFRLSVFCMAKGMTYVMHTDNYSKIELVKLVKQVF